MSRGSCLSQHVTSEERRSRPRAISTARLHGSHRFHLRPIYVLFSNGPYSFDGIPHLEACFALRCFQRLSLMDLDTQLMRLVAQLVHQRSTPPGPLVLGRSLLKYPAPATDRDRTVSRRSEPSSRTALMGGQPNPWDRLQPQDAMSRHRGAKHRRRYGLSDGISLLSPE